eukprot:Tamp_14958.p2 GENE.Tamp_14958~~Tamp_14958.p2  ORF type:complete len:175 (+),score=10.51 Tamp_14958:597-1121(+)
MCACMRTCIHTYEVDCTHGSCARRFSLTASHACSTLLHECSVMNDGKRWSGSASVVSWVVSLAPVLYRHESLAALQSACPQVKIRAMTHLSGWAVYPSPTAAVAGTSGYQHARMRVCVRACVCACVRLWETLSRCPSHYTTTNTVSREDIAGWAAAGRNAAAGRTVPGARGKSS